MQQRKPSPFPDFMQQSMVRNSKIQQAIEYLGTNEVSDADRARILSPFRLDERAYIEYMEPLRRRGPFDQTLFMKAFRETAPVVAMPRTSDLHFDTFAALCQPEMLEALADWEAAAGERGFAANPAFTRGVLASLIFQTGSRVKGTCMNLAQQPDMVELFWGVEELVAAYAGREPFPSAAREYSTVLDQIAALSFGAGQEDGIARRLMRASMQMVKALALLYPDAGIGQVGVVDGTDVAAWCPQNQDGSSRARNAGLKVITYGRNGKETVDSDADVKPMASKVWNGWYLVVLVELKTGLPLVWTLRNAKWDEAAALKELLFLLKEIDPDWPLKTIVGDGAWDEAPQYKLCELDYGIHPVFRRGKGTARAEHLLQQGRSKWVARTDEKPYWHATMMSDSIAGYDGRGVVYCREHGAVLSYVGGTWGSRTGLQPGDEADPAGFRVRFEGSCGCGRPSLPVGIDWDAFPYYPHHTDGMPDRYAMRLALGTRRNIVESLFSALKTTAHLGLRGAARTRLHDYDTVLTLISLAFGLRSSFLLAGERVQRGLFPDVVPDDVTGLMPTGVSVAASVAA